MNSRLTALAILVVSALLISACASNPDKIDAAYVSPLKYLDYDCKQIAMEMDYVGQRTTELYHRLEKERNADNWQMGIGLIVFWPALFFLEGGDGPEATEYAQLKGEFEALRENSVSKSCGIDALSPEEIMASAQEGEREEALDQVEVLEAQHVIDVREIAESMNCRRVVTLKDVTKDVERWALGCEDGSTVNIECRSGTCYTRE